MRDVKDSTNAVAQWLQTRGRWRWWLLMLCLCWLVPRLLFLDADPPDRLPNDINGALDFVVEPPAKAHEARNYALFGTWKTNPADEYQFWRRQSPVWVYSLALTFRTFGVSYVVLRAFSVAVAALGFALALALARRRHEWLVILAAFPLWAFNFYAVAWDRSGLIEVMISTWVIAMVYCLDRGREHPAWLVASQLAFAAAFFAKQGAIYAFPLLVGVNLLVWWRAAPEGAWAGWRRFLPVASAAATALLALWLIRHPDYQRALQWNYDHMLFSEDDGGGGPLRSVVVRMQDIGRYYKGYLGLFPIAGLLAAVGAGHTLLRGIGQGVWARHPTLMTAWLGFAWLTLNLSRQTEVRFFAVLAAPVALLACEGVSVIYRWAAKQPRPWVGHVLVGGCLLLGSSIQINWLGIWFRTPTYHIRDLGHLIADRIGDRPAVVIGRYAVPLTLETPYEVYYVKHGFNTTPEVIEALAPTHGVWQEHREVTKTFLARFGSASRDFEVLGVSELLGEEITFFEWNAPLVAPSNRGKDHEDEDDEDDEDEEQGQGEARDGSGARDGSRRRPGN